jgi:glutamate--cysteine ligase
MNFKKQGYENLELSTQILINEALRRKINVDILDKKENFIKLKRGTKVEYIKQATKTSTDSYITALIMENKAVTKHILNENKIKVPEGTIYNDLNEARIDYDLFKKKSVVVKPNNTNFGIGVSILKDNNSKKDFIEALKIAFNHDKSVIVEEFIEGKEYRFLIINDKVVGVLHRIPANVKGDGIHSIEELVIEKNKNPLRGKSYKTPLEKLNLGDIEQDYLKMQGKNINTIPQKDEVVFLRKNSNISTGGDSIDFTDEVNDVYKKIAISSAKAVGTKICGADIIIKDIHEKPDDNNYSVIELNFNPALHIHAYPFKGINRYPEKYVLDLLGFEEEHNA